MFQHRFTAVRASAPHWPTVLRTLKAQDPTVGGGSAFDPFFATFDKTTDWTQAQIDQAQTYIDTTAPDDTPQIRAQFDVDDMPIWLKALLLSLLDQINLLRAKHALAAITPAQAIRAVRDKAGIL